MLAMAASALGLGLSPACASQQRIAAIDWAVLETLLALGVTPVAATELVLFREIAVEPPVPASVTDLGLRGTVNYEALLLAQPDLILSSNFYAANEPRLRRIAPVESFRVFAPGVASYALAEEMTRKMGGLLSRDDAAARYIASNEQMFLDMRARLADGTGRPAIAISLGDARHFRVFGRDSIFGAVLEKLGLRNSWTQPTSYSAMAPIGLETLAFLPEAWIVIISPVPPDAQSSLPNNTFWNALPNVRSSRVVTLPAINPFGALPAAARFARLLSEALVSASSHRNG